MERTQRYAQRKKSTIKFMYIPSSCKLFHSWHGCGFLFFSRDDVGRLQTSYIKAIVSKKHLVVLSFRCVSRRRACVHYFNRKYQLF